jgi:hypothetical protein
MNIGWSVRRDVEMEGCVNNVTSIFETFEVRERANNINNNNNNDDDDNDNDQYNQAVSIMGRGEPKFFSSLQLSFFWLELLRQHRHTLRHTFIGRQGAIDIDKTPYEASVPGGAHPRVAHLLKTYTG